MPKQIIMSVYGKDASARLTLNSCCTSGNTTATTYMLLLPNVTNSTVVSKRQAA
jgi:hypothetical protein